MLHTCLTILLQPESHVWAMYSQPAKAIIYSSIREGTQAKAGRLLQADSKSVRSNMGSIPSKRVHRIVAQLLFSVQGLPFHR
mmetsp:Transcript_4511/g.28694  ORF Transcript_4511/g.28694 Transcript_4511/m.28694 type:complete len:82 (-) Transcript_4511:3017-3262(-)